MDVTFVIRSRLAELGFEQKDLAAAAEVTESYVSQLLSRKKVARAGGRSYKQTRVKILEFLDTDVFNVSAENCVSFLNPLLKSWKIDLLNFSMEIVLNQRLVPGHLMKLEFVERGMDDPSEDEPGLAEFLQDAALSGNVTRDEIAFLRVLTFRGRRPSPLYYYRELQNLRDPIHFRTAVLSPRTSRT